MELSPTPGIHADRQTIAIVANLQNEPAISCGRGNGDLAGTTGPRQSMDYGVLHKRLEQKARYEGVPGGRVDLPLHT